MRMILLFGLAWVMLLSGCAAKIETSYYSLQVPLAASGGQAGDISATVGPITLPDILKQTRIATDGESGVFHLSEYHRWSGELDRDLGRALVEDIRTKHDYVEQRKVQEDIRSHFKELVRMNKDNWEHEYEHWNSINWR